MLPTATHRYPHTEEPYPLGVGLVLLGTQNTSPGRTLCMILSMALVCCSVRPSVLHPYTARTSAYKGAKFMVRAASFIILTVLGLNTGRMGCESIASLISRSGTVVTTASMLANIGMIRAEDFLKLNISFSLARLVPI